MTKRVLFDLLLLYVALSQKELNVKENIQNIIDCNVFRASKAIDAHYGVDKEALKKRIRKLIFYTADDIVKQLTEGEKDVLDKNTN